MGWAIYEGQSGPDLALDRFRDAIATLSENGEVIGYLVTDVSLSFRRSGRRRLRPVWLRGEQVCSWIVLESGPHAPYSELEFTDPSDFADGRVAGRTWRGGPYELRWLDGAEFAAAWAKYEGGWNE